MKLTKKLIVKAIPCFVLFQVAVEVYWQRLKESLCHQVTQLGILQTQHADGQSLYQTTIMWSNLQCTEFTLRRIETACKLLSYINTTVVREFLSNVSIIIKPMKFKDSFRMTSLLCLGNDGHTSFKRKHLPYCWFARDVMASILVVKNKNISGK